MGKLGLLQLQANDAEPMTPLKCLEVTLKQTVTLTQTLGLL